MRRRSLGKGFQSVLISSYTEKLEIDFTKKLKKVKVYGVTIKSWPYRTQ